MPVRAEYFMCYRGNVLPAALALFKQKFCCGRAYPRRPSPRYFFIIIINLCEKYRRGVRFVSYRVF